VSQSWISRVQIGFNTVLCNSILFSSVSCEFLPSSRYILISVYVYVGYMFSPLKLSVEVHAEIFGVIGLWKLNSIWIESRTACGARPTRLGIDFVGIFTVA